MLVELLALLAERPGEVVSKSRILDRLRDRRIVGESTLTRDVADLRRLLGDDVRRPQYIQTISKRGYRLVAPVHARAFAEPTVAVLPFENLSRDPDDEYFADGLGDAVTTELGRIASLRVISRQSVLRFKGATLALRDIARELGVDALVEGTAFRAGDRFRITAQLVQAEPEQHLWAERYECAAADLLAAEGRIARAVAESVRGALPAADLAILERTRRVDPDAHLEYLKARHHWDKWTQEGLQKGLAHARRAIERDPTYAPAHEMLARSFAVLGYWGFVPGRQAYPVAKEAALRAIDLDDSLPDAHAALALVCWIQDWDLETCARESERAISLGPSSEFARFVRAKFLVMMRGDCRGALEEARVAMALDPLSLSTNFSMAWVLIFSGQYERGAAQAASTVDMYPENVRAYFALGHAELARGRYAEAVAAFEKAVALEREPTSLGSLGHAYGRAGMPDDARAVLAELHERSGQEEIPHYIPAMVHIGLGEDDVALALLEKAFAERDGRLFGIGVIPAFMPLRGDPRFEDLTRRLGLPSLASS
jgi:TolB-like protein/Tfp pilus assembly protein PilF